MTTLLEAAKQMLEALKNDQLDMVQDSEGHMVFRKDQAITALRQAIEQAQEPVIVDLATMELAESVGLIGPASRTHDLHNAIQRFHDLICANATIKAAVAFSRTLEAKDEPLTENGMYRLGYHNGYGFGEAYGKANAPQRTWVGLDDEDYIKALELADFDKDAAFEFFEAKLKEKNT
jgi:hypothetical protein